MNLTELKKKSPAELIAIAQELKLEGMARSRKQDVIFGILKAWPRAARIFPAMACWKSCKMASAFCARPTALI
jgi:transcription termination factor Rho